MISLLVLCGSTWVGRPIRNVAGMGFATFTTNNGGKNIRGNGEDGTKDPYSVPTWERL